MSTKATAWPSRPRNFAKALNHFKERCANAIGRPVMKVATLPRVEMTAAVPDGNIDKVALVICHGMGQQVRWHTLADLVETLRQSGRVTQVGTRLARFVDEEGELILGRVDVTVDNPGGRPKEVHLYEQYWAPITEGRVRLRDVAAFLKDAGIRGIRYTFKPFCRFMFGRSERFRSTPFVALPIAFVLAVFLSLVSLNATVALVTAQGVLESSRNADARSMVTLYVAATEAIVFAYLLIAFGVYAFSMQRRRKHPDYHISWLAQFMLWVLLVAVCAVIVGAGVLVPWNFVQATDSSIPLPLVATVTVWAIAGWFAARTRAVLVQYVGDVVAYVSAFRVSRYEEIRNKIQESAARVLCALYESGGYGRYVIAGHSLGSVVAYDALNAVIRKDCSEPALEMRVVERTPAFITFGSPLDKIAFIFRTQSKNGDVREALASQWQPLIDEPTRPRWINIFSPQDPISGSLDFFDHPSDPRCRVENIRDYQADLPVFAHTQYWSNRALVNAVLTACISEKAIGQPGAGSVDVDVDDILRVAGYAQRA